MYLMITIRLLLSFQLRSKRRKPRENKQYNEIVQCAHLEQWTLKIYATNKNAYLIRYKKRRDQDNCVEEIGVPNSILILHWKQMS